VPRRARLARDARPATWRRGNIAARLVWQKNIAPSTSIAAAPSSASAPAGERRVVRPRLRAARSATSAPARANAALVAIGFDSTRSIRTIARASRSRGAAAYRAGMPCLESRRWPFRSAAGRMLSTGEPIPWGRR
jgi:hypothetical protein